MRGLRTGIIAFCFVWIGAGTASASSLVPQTWLPGECIPQFASPLPVFGPGYNAALPRVNALLHPALTVKMKEISQQVLTGVSTDPSLGCPPVTIQPTRVWAYETSNSLTKKVLGPAHWPAVTLETRRFIPTVMNFVNELPSFNPANPTGPGMVQGLVSVDQTVHWADPNGTCMDPTMPGCNGAYVGPVPAVVHLHGGEVPSQFDGGPGAWFTPDGKKGPTYSSLWPVGPGKAVYLYNNFQEPGTPWIHDHALGATRTNVYSGMAAFYFIRDPGNEPANLPAGAYEIEMAIQDRQFDTKSQLFFPDGSGADASLSNLNGTPPNPAIHSFWNPEFAGDVVVVNGVPWPFFNVEPRRYRFRVVGGSNARFYNLDFGGVPVYAIGADDAYLDAPVKVGTVFLAPGERADVIVDFSGFAGQNITVTNDARVPYPDGLLPGPGGDQPQMGNIMQFRVTLPIKGADRSCNPAIPGQCARPKPMVRLTDGSGNMLVAPDRKRQLILKEAQGPGGPLEVLVNNTKFDGLKSPGIQVEFPGDGVSELPRVGSTELWEIINLTMDAHPMHTHLVQFQIVDRQPFNTDTVDPAVGYPAKWASAFFNGANAKCGTPSFDDTNPCPGYGPPLSYKAFNADGALGGNPAVGPYLVGAKRPPAPEESGWKDTAKAMPGEVLRILVRWAPTSTPVKWASPGRNFFPFDPTKGPGYVWHCHIIDHEDNEMMRPYSVAR